MDKRQAHSLFKTSWIVLVLLTIAFAFGRGPAASRSLQERLLAASVSHDTRTVRFQELDDLPAPVQRYFRTVLKDGQPIATIIRIYQTGAINLSATEERWRLFKAEHIVITQRAGFDWKAQVAVMPGVTAGVHDAYIDGQQIFTAYVLGLIPLWFREPSQVARGGLLQFLVEAPWYPTALLPSQGIRWQATDRDSATATLRDAHMQVTALFKFDDQGLIESVLAVSERRRADGSLSRASWENRCSHYEIRAGMRVPLDCMAAWTLAAGPKAYWRVHVMTFGYDFAATD